MIIKNISFSYRSVHHIEYRWLDSEPNIFVCEQNFLQLNCEKSQWISLNVSNQFVIFEIFADFDWIVLNLMSDFNNEFWRHVLCASFHRKSYQFFLINSQLVLVHIGSTSFSKFPRMHLNVWKHRMENNIPTKYVISLSTDFFFCQSNVYLSIFVRTLYPRHN